MRKNLWENKVYNSVAHKTAIVMVAVFLLSFIPEVKARATESYLWDDYTNEQIVEAIWHAEGGSKTKFPYGIKSIPTYGNKDYARQICLNSVRNGRARWIVAGKPYDLIIYIGLRFCPPKAHKLNSNWVTNVKFYLRR